MSRSTFKAMSLDDLWDLHKRVIDLSRRVRTAETFKPPLLHCRQSAAGFLASYAGLVKSATGAPS
jgi:hypothetical protein